MWYGLYGDQLFSSLILFFCLFIPMAQYQHLPIYKVTYELLLRARGYQADKELQRIIL